MTPSSTHLVLIPSFDSGPRLAATVEEALRHWCPVWVVVDGSTDGSDGPVRARALADSRLRVIVHRSNEGKGAAVATGVREALASGFTHVLTLDSDGQHPADHIGAFMLASAARPEALVLGRPVFGPEAPQARLQGRKLSVLLARLEILGGGIDDPLFGFRVYPAAAFQKAYATTRHARRFDFDHEMAVRMFWLGTPTVNLPAPCRYLSRGEGGVSHFHYLRDNLLLAWLHVRLITALALGKAPTVRRVRRLVGAAILCLAAHRAGAAAPAPPPAGFPGRDPAWSALIASLAPGVNREGAFEELRYFPFRRTPVILTGELRMAAGRGLSLAYLTPSPRIVIVDERGVLIRIPDQPDFAAPGGDRLQAISAILVEVIAFDLARIARDFTVDATRRAREWRLVLTPRLPLLASQFHSIVVSGTDTQLTRIVLTRSARQRIEILVQATRAGVAFSPATLARYFR